METYLGLTTGPLCETADGGGGGPCGRKYVLFDLTLAKVESGATPASTLSSVLRITGGDSGGAERV